MRYKMMISDMDGTLLDDDCLIPPENISAIRRLREAGIVFTIASGRPAVGADYYNPSLNIDGLIITQNGAVVCERLTKKSIYTQYLSEEAVDIIMRVAELFDVTAVIWIENELYVNKVNERSKIYTIQSGDVEATLVKSKKDDEKLLEIEAQKCEKRWLKGCGQFDKKRVSKILFTEEADVIESAQRELDKYMDGKFSHFTSSPCFLEIVDYRVSKGKALEMMCNYMGIKREETIVIGDGYNDLPMLLYGGLSIAMDNAPDDIKEKVDFVTKSNVDNGFAYAVDMILSKGIG